MNILKSKRSFKITAAIAVCLVIFSYLVLTYSSNVYPNWNYQVDEGVWIATGHYYFRIFFIEEDWNYATWQEERFESFSTRQPTIGKYIIGGAIYLWGEGATYDLVPGYDLTPFDWSIVSTLRPPPVDLKAGRQAIIWSTVLSCVALFLLTRSLAQSWLTGLVVAVCFTLNPLVLLIGRWVLLDMPALLFSVFSLWVGLNLCDRIALGQWWSALLWAVGLGVTFGLAISTKLNVLLILGVLILWAVTNLAWIYLSRYPLPFLESDVATARQGYFAQLPHRLQQSGNFIGWTIGCFGLALLLAWLIFWGTNPFLYPHPIQNTVHMLELGQIVAGYSVPDAQLLNSWGKRIISLLSIGSVKYGLFDYWFDLFIIDAVMISLGTLMCGYIVVGGGYPGQVRRNYSFFILWAGLVTAGILYWTPFSWPRYYLPTVPIWAFLEGHGILGSVLLCQKLYLHFDRLQLKTELS